MRKSSTGAGGLVYSTDSGRMCPACRQPVSECRCKTSAPAPAGEGIVRIGRETGGRGGKTVTIVRGLQMDDAALTTLARRLKAVCGTGGTVKDGVLELQGDHRDTLMALLSKEGMRVKRAGG